MSGGHYEYRYCYLDYLADDIERDFLQDGKYSSDFVKGGMADRIGDATEEERPFILAEIRSLISDLRSCAKRAQELEWYMSGDTGATTYLKRLED